MKLRLLCILALTAFAGLAGCKSKELTSAIIHNQTGRYDLAIETAKEAIAQNPEEPEAYFQLGVAYSNLDSVGLAYENFKRAAELDPRPKRQDNVQNNIQSNFAKHYNQALKMDTHEEKLVEFKKAASANPEDPKGHFQVGRTYVLLGDETENPDYYKQAIPELDRVLELAGPSDTHYMEALKLAGETLARAGEPEEAISRFNRLVEEDPTSFNVVENIGYQRLDRQDWRGSAVFLELAARARAKIKKDDFNLYYNLGVAYFQMGKEDSQYLPEAIGNYEKALELNPDEPQTVFNVVATYVVANDWERAVMWGERYVDLKPSDGNGWRLLSKSYTELGEQEKARQCLARYEAIQRGE